MLSTSAQLESLSDLCVMSTSSNSSKICDFFDRGRHCRFGRSCKFLHIRSSDSQENPPCSSKQSVAVSVGEEEVREAFNQLSVLNQNDAPQQPQQRKLCFFFSKFNRCKFGKGCRFEHIRDETKTKSRSSVKPVKPVKEEKDVNDYWSEDDENEEAEEAEKAAGSEASPVKNEDSAKGQEKTTATRVCRYFKMGYCSMGMRCRFRHPDEYLLRIGRKDEGEEPAEKGAQPPQKPLQTQKPQSKRFQPYIHILEELSDDDLKKFRSDEIAQLKKRYPKGEENVDKGVCKIQFIFVPSDPDWPYDVKIVPLVLGFKEDYPHSMLDATLMDSDGIPDTLQRLIVQSIRSWVQLRHERFREQGKVELMVRPMLKWLDRNVEEMFTTGLKQYKKELVAKAAGLTFVTANELQEKYAAVEEDSQSNESEEEEGEGSNIDEEEEEDLEDDEETDEEDEEGGVSTSRQPIDPAARGTEVKLQNLQLKNSLSTLMATKVSLQLQCSRCRFKNDLTTPVARVNAVSCNQCGAVSTVAFRAALVHENSSVMGYADVDGCTVFDVIMPECSFMAGCLNCSKEMLIEGVNAGQPTDTWCRNCNAKMRLVADSIRFFRLQPAVQITDEKTVHKVEAKRKRAPKDPAIQDGFPLPDDGICKHYKKSYRWFRFPCCGKAYPCDVCHDEKEDHCYTFATRMLCGHCAKEQPYAAERACLRCGESLTKKRSTHWEGGKGCRDRIKMARDDPKKYSNLNKTISKKSQATGATKRTTRLRHT